MTEAWITWWQATGGTLAQRGSSSHRNSFSSRKPKAVRVHVSSWTRVTRHVLNLFSVLIYANTFTHVYTSRHARNSDCVSRV